MLQCSPYVPQHGRERGRGWGLRRPQHRPCRPLHPQPMAWSPPGVPATPPPACSCPPGRGRVNTLGGRGISLAAPRPSLPRPTCCRPWGLALPFPGTKGKAVIWLHEPAPSASSLWPAPSRVQPPFCPDFDFLLILKSFGPKGPAARPSASRIRDPGACKAAVLLMQSSLWLCMQLGPPKTTVMANAGSCFPGSDVQHRELQERGGSGAQSQARLVRGEQPHSHHHFHRAHILPLCSPWW